MRKLRFAVALPLAQFVVAVILLQWAHRVPIPQPTVPTPAMICNGLNAPALLVPIPFKVFAAWGHYQFGWEPAFERVFGFEWGELLFLVGVILVWYLVGRALDRRQNSGTTARTRKATSLIAHALMLVLGAVLVRAGMQDIPLPRFGNPGDFGARAAPYLTLTWAMSLLFIGGRGLVKTIRPAQRKAE